MGGNADRKDFRRLKGGSANELGSEGFVRFRHLKLKRKLTTKKKKNTERNKNDGCIKE